MPGDTLELTIDSYLQHVAERELAAGVALNKAAGGSVVVMDPRSGEILALANYPSFNPNEYRRLSPTTSAGTGPCRRSTSPGPPSRSSPRRRRSRSACSRRTTWWMPAPASGASASRIVREAKDHNYGVLSFTDVIVKSSNVGAIKIGLSLGAERLGRYVHRFGFGTRVFGDLPGESPGMLADPSDWSAGTIASISMGYEVGVTPVQMAAAVSAVANGGVYMQPRIVRALRRGDGAHRGHAAGSAPRDQRRTRRRRW